MPATPPVGRNLYKPLLTDALSPFWKLWRMLPVASSRRPHVVDVIQRMSNFDSDASMSAPATAGSRDNTRMESLKPTNRPLNCKRLSLTMPGNRLRFATRCYLARRAMAIASAKLM